LFFAYADVLEDLGRKAEAKKWADLGNKAAQALAGPNGPEDELLQIFEEIEIPQRRVWLDDEEYAKVREREARREREAGTESPRRSAPAREGHSRPRRDSDARPRRDFDVRPNRGDSARAPRNDDARPMRKARPQSDDVRPKRNRD
jgi:hypothetical protein